MRITTTIELRPKILLNISIVLASFTVLILLFRHEFSRGSNSKIARDSAEAEPTTEDLSLPVDKNDHIFQAVKNLKNQRKKEDQESYKDLKSAVSSFDDTFEVDLSNDPVLERPPTNPNAPGESGKAINIDEKNLSEDEKATKAALLKKYAINHFAGDKISLHRTPGDHRQKGCKKLNYDRVLPNTSVIVTFYNEHWTTLMRTIYSILHESSKGTLKELILVDDMSDQEHLGGRLERELKDLPRVRLIRTTTRQGLVRARMLGAQ